MSTSKNGYSFWVLLLVGVGMFMLTGCPGTGPTALFTASPTSGAAPLTVAFTDLSTPGTSPITAWAWDFGDGTTSTEQHPSHTYTEAGTYDISLTVTTDVGTASESKADYITVNVLPEAAFSASPTSGIALLSVVFTDLSTPGSSPITAWVWDFGDGGTSTEQNPAHTYTEAGTYDISLTVSSAAGSATETRTQYVAVAALPVAAFSASPTEGLGPLAVVFADLSTPGSSPITAWAWDFGDGGSSAEQNPAHTYTEPGVYAVALTVTTEVGSVTETKPGYITVTALPTPDFRVAPSSGAAPLTVSFTDLSTPGTSPITSWVWLFGDGTSSAEQHPVHTYSSPGAYSVSLTVASEVGSVSASKADFIIVGELPSAAFSAAPTSGTAPLNVTFTDASMPVSFPITGWAWDFGDGGTSTEQDPAHTYTVPGTYSVSLTVTTDVGSNTETKTDFVVINKDVWYVKAGASGGAGNSWDAALGSIQDAVDAASSAGGGKVWVAAGTYTGLEEQVLLMRASVALYGGFLGTESKFEQRNWNTNPTIIDGEDTRRCAVGADNAGLDGFVVQHGYVHGSNGAGMYNDGVSLVLENCTFLMNISELDTQCYKDVPYCMFFGGYGGGIYNKDSSPEMANCCFKENRSDRSGGGMCNVAYSSPVLRNCRFLNNTAEASADCIKDFCNYYGGGGMYNGGSSLVMTDCVFSGNTATDYLARGAGVYDEGCPSTVLANCTFEANLASGNGGGMYIDYCSPVLTNCRFVRNVADSGGGLCCSEGDSAPTVTNCTFFGNTAEDSGGGMYNTYSSPAVLNCVFFMNTADAGGGMANSHSFSALTNSTFGGNMAIYGRGMCNSCSSLVVTNCILWDGAATPEQELYNPSSCSSLAVTYSCVQGGYEGMGNIAEDPLLLQGRGAKGHIRPNSPCIDAGTAIGAPETDIRGVTRPQGAGVDMGAYELDDSDADGISDTWEQEHFGNLTAASATSDADGDGLSDLDESLYGTDSEEIDSDGDRLSDGEEVQEGWDPTLPTAFLRVSSGNTSGTEDGLSWVTAFTSIQAAVDAVQAMGEGEVWVAQGTYTGKAGDIVTMAEHVYLYGGFAGTETVREQRDWTARPTIIDGEGTRSLVNGANHAALDGFVLQNGQQGRVGGGLYCYHTSPVVINCSFSGNTAHFGGGLYCNDASPTLTNCSFSGNTAYHGGGIYCYSASPVLTNCTFSGNTADKYGGGIYCYSASPVLTNCTFSGNTAAEYGGGMYSYGASPVLTNCSFSANTATYGGGLYCEDGSPALTSCTFSENTASYFGGGLYCHDVSPALTTCIFSGNTTPYRGGGLYCDDASLALTSCSFSGNTAFSGGGGLYCYYGSLALMNCSFSGNMASNGGGGLHCYYVSPALTNCSFSGNTSDDAGGGLYCDDASPALTNCILWGDTATNLGGEIYTDPASSPTVTYSCVQGGYTGEGNIATDPLFVDAANGELRLQAASPCIDAGTADGAPSTDFLGVLRPQGAGYDMGAYEYAGG